MKANKKSFCCRQKNIASKLVSLCPDDWLSVECSFPFCMYSNNPISVFCHLLFSLDINGSFYEKAVLFMKLLNEEGRNSFSTKKCHISTTMFLRAQLDRF